MKVHGVPDGGKAITVFGSIKINVPDGAFYFNEKDDEFKILMPKGHVEGYKNGVFSVDDEIETKWFIELSDTDYSFKLPVNADQAARREFLTNKIEELAKDYIGVDEGNDFVHGSSCHIDENTGTISFAMPELKNAGGDSIPAIFSDNLAIKYLRKSVYVYSYTLTYTRAFVFVTSGNTVYSFNVGLQGFDDDEDYKKQKNATLGVLQSIELIAAESEEAQQELTTEDILNSINYSKGNRLNLEECSFLVPEGMHYSKKINSSVRLITCIEQNTSLKQGAWEKARCTIILQQGTSVSSIDDDLNSEDGKESVNSLIESLDIGQDEFEELFEEKYSEKDYAVYSAVRSKGEDFIGLVFLFITKSTLYIGQFQVRWDESEGPKNKFYKLAKSKCSEWLKTLQISGADTAQIKKANGQKLYKSYAGSDGKIDAFKALSLFSNDVLFFNSPLTYHNNHHDKHRVSFNAIMAGDNEDLMDIMDDYTGGLDVLLTYIEKQESLRIPASGLPKKMQKFMLGYDITGLSLFEFAQYHMLFINCDEPDSYTVFIEKHITDCVDNPKELAERLIDTLRQFNGLELKYEYVLHIFYNIEVQNSGDERYDVFENIGLAQLPDGVWGYVGDGGFSCLTDDPNAAQNQKKNKVNKKNAGTTQLAASKVSQKEPIKRESGYSKPATRVPEKTYELAKRLMKVLSTEPQTASELAAAVGDSTLSILNIANAVKYIAGVKKTKVVRKAINSKGLTGEKEYTAFYADGPLSLTDKLEVSSTSSESSRRRSNDGFESNTTSFSIDVGGSTITFSASLKPVESSSSKSSARPKELSEKSLALRKEILNVLSDTPMTTAEIGSVIGNPTLSALNVANALKGCEGVNQTKVRREFTNVKGLKDEKEFTAYYYTADAWASIKQSRSKTLNASGNPKTSANTAKPVDKHSEMAKALAPRIEAVLSGVPMTIFEIMEALGDRTLPATQISSAMQYLPEVKTTNVKIDTVDSRGLKVQKDHTGYYIGSLKSRDGEKADTKPVQTAVTGSSAVNEKDSKKASSDSKSQSAENKNQSLNEKPKKKKKLKTVVIILLIIIPIIAGILIKQALTSVSVVSPSVLQGASLVDAVGSGSIETHKERGSYFNNVAVYQSGLNMYLVANVHLSNTGYVLLCSEWGEILVNADVDESGDTQIVLKIPAYIWMKGEKYGGRKALLFYDDNDYCILIGKFSFE